LNNAAPDSTPLKQAIIAATRALAHKHKLTVSFGESRNDNSDVRLPLFDTPVPKEELSRIRGVADHAALFVRYHDPKIHNSLKPSSAYRPLFDALEGIRVETVGSEDMTGVKSNLYRRFEHLWMQSRLHGKPLPLLATVELYARQAIEGQPMASFMEAKASEGIAKKILPALEQMREHVADQKKFATLALDLIDTLSQSAHSLEKGDRPDAKQATDKQEDKEQVPQEQEAEQAPFGTSSDKDRSQADATQVLAAGLSSDEAPSEQAEESERRAAPYPSNYHDAKSSELYRAYTTQFDEVVPASQLATAAEIDYLRRQLDEKLSRFQSVTARLASRLQRLLLARQARQWLFDEEDGMIDNRKLARVITNPGYELFYKREKDTEFRDTVVCLLIDNSGSMRGRPITMAAMSADIISRTLERCGVKVEILGFTTKEWKGGQSYKKWIKDNRPKQPGRLNDLRHIIYKPADVSWRKGKRNIGLMLKDGILKENIDGEAILWACDRLLARPEQRRILMVISDGAPVDDSTLSVNNGSYLDRHLREVIARVETQMPIELVAIGIGHDVTRYYKRAVTISDIDRLGETMTEQLAALFSEDGIAKRKRA